MDGRAFDDLTRAYAGVRSRRALLKALGGGLVGALAGALGGRFGLVVQANHCTAPQIHCSLSNPANNYCCNECTKCDSSVQICLKDSGKNGTACGGTRSGRVCCDRADAAPPNNGNCCPECQNCNSGNCVNPTSNPATLRGCGGPGSTRVCCRGTCCPEGVTTCTSGGFCSACPAATPTNCSGICVNTQTNPSHCGGCGIPCPTGPNGTATCTAGSCGLACNAGFGNCDGSAGNGCETNTATDAANCGACGNVCANLPNVASASCSGGQCVDLACEAGFANCDGDATDGCETNTTNDVDNCGGCGNVCPSATLGSCEGARTCVNGTCGFDPLTEGTVCRPAAGECDVAE